MFPVSPPLIAPPIFACACCPLCTHTYCITSYCFVCLFVFFWRVEILFARFSFHATNLRLSTFDSFEKPPIQFRGASSFPSCSFFSRRVFGVFFFFCFYLNIPTGLRNVDVCFVEQNRIFNELLIFFFGTFLLFLGPFFH